MHSGSKAALAAWVQASGLPCCVQSGSKGSLAPCTRAQGKLNCMHSGVQELLGCFLNMLVVTLFNFQVRRERAKQGVPYKPLWFKQSEPNVLTRQVCPMASPFTHFVHLFLILECCILTSKKTVHSFCRWRLAAFSIRVRVRCQNKCACSLSCLSTNHFGCVLLACSPSSQALLGFSMKSTGRGNKTRTGERCQTCTHRLTPLKTAQLSMRQGPEGGF